MHIAVFSFVTFMKLSIHSGIGITPGVNILSELPRFTLRRVRESLRTGLHSMQCSHTCVLGIASYPAVPGFLL